MVDYVATLPDDILQLLAAGSNKILALWRVSRRLAAICAPPPLVRRGDLVRRGRFELDLAAKHDAVINAPVLVNDDAVALWEILGVGIINIIAYRRVIYNRYLINPTWFSGAVYGRFVTDGYSILVLGTSVHAVVGGNKHSMCTVTSDDDPDPTYLIIDTLTVLGKVYWVGDMESVTWFAAKIESVMMLRITASWCDAL